ncbi:tetratricopeptide repeat protein 29-like [Apostichopus japonicus]|uniref:tetratricopeptide repeat protein 29-like n=1 Tax=Stichopus japonicus TaxID=307972 RepID=UPI003AB22D79
MAAPLPVIRNTQVHSPLLNNPVMEERIPSPPNKSRPSAHLVQGRRSREQRLKSHSRQKQSDLSKLDAQRYRNTYFHNLCLEVLKDGFHRSFSEVFSLVKDQQGLIDSAGVDSLVQDRTLLADQHAKLDKMKQHLTEAELSLRICDMRGVYAARHKLADYFLEIGDLTLSDHFFQSCLEMAVKVPDDDQKVVGEAHCNMGLAFERRSQFDDAAAHFEEYYTLAKEKQWKTEEGISLHSEACEHLRRLYTAIADTHRKTDTEEEINCLQKAFDMAKESRDGRKEGEASYKLGLAYEHAGDAETALEYLSRYMDLCRNFKDQEGMGRACEAIAKCYERQGKLEEAVRYLEMFVEVAEQTEQQKAHCQACSCLGSIYNSLGQYDKASHFFGKAYTTARSTGDSSNIEATRVLFGIASAHLSFGSFAMLVEHEARPSSSRLMEWKDVRKEEFVDVMQDQGEEG